jgi:hypothetical protein
MRGPRDAWFDAIFLKTQSLSVKDPSILIKEPFTEGDIIVHSSSVKKLKSETAEEITAFVKGLVDLKVQFFAVT